MRFSEVGDSAHSILGIKTRCPLTFGLRTANPLSDHFKSGQRLSLQNRPTEDAYDWCSAEKVYQRSQMIEVYKKMHDALVRTGRPIVFSLCQYGYERVWRWGASVGGNAWRTTEDINDHYDRMSVIGFDQDGLEPFAGPGHWNDPDMLEVGNGGMNHDEYITHMSLWVLLANQSIGSFPSSPGNGHASFVGKCQAIV